MRKVWFVLILLLSVAVFSSAAEEFPERWVLSKYIKNNQVSIPAGAVLAVRSGPGVSYDEVDSLGDRHPITEYDRIGDWIRISPKVEAQPVAPRVEAQPVAPRVEAQPVAPRVEAQPVTPKVDAEPVTLKKESDDSNPREMIFRYGVIITGLIATILVLLKKSLS